MLFDPEKVPAEIFKKHSVALINRTDAELTADEVKALVEAGLLDAPQMGILKETPKPGTTTEH
jgi:hypothetical protein